MNNFNDIEQRLHTDFKKSLDMRNEWIFKIQSTLLMVSSTAFAVLVSLSLGNASSDNPYNRVLLAFSFLLNTVCILSSSISLFENRAMSNEMSRISYNKLEEFQLRKNGIDVPSSKQYASRKRIFVICESISYISFLFFIISLTIYALYKLLFM